MPSPTPGHDNRSTSTSNHSTSRSSVQTAATNAAAAADSAPVVKLHNESWFDDIELEESKENCIANTNSATMEVCTTIGRDYHCD